VGEVMPLILASGSRARREMLAAAGLAFEVIPADVDEAAIRDRMLSATPVGDPAHIAVALARAKAEQVSHHHPDARVIGADQVLVLGSRLFEKPQDVPAARVQLLELRSKLHQLVSAVAIAEGGAVVWSTVTQARMTMRPFTDAFLDSYLSHAGERVTESVGAYQLEGLGVQLFERIEGDYFTILGMPMLPLLDALRARGVIAA
jgi:septum formation protein